MQVGRLAYVHDDQLSITPVNFLLDGRDVLLRTAEGSELLAAARLNAPGAFEVDDIVNWSRSGWSVLIRGRLSELTEPAHIHQALHSTLKPWAGGDRDHVVRLTGEEVTGRRIEPGPGGSTVVQL